MSPRPAWLAVATLVVVEAYLTHRYLAFGAQFHLLLHGYVGAAVGLAAWAVAHRRGAAAGAAPWLAAGAGHLASAAPDVLFLAADLPHQTWMDVFVAHISIHFVPAPLWWSFGMLAIGVLAAAAATLGRRLVAVTAAAGVVLAGAMGLALADALPRTLQQVRAHPQIAWCPLEIADG